MSTPQHASGPWSEMHPPPGVPLKTGSVRVTLDPGQTPGSSTASGVPPATSKGGTLEWHVRLLSLPLQYFFPEAAPPSPVLPLTPLLPVSQEPAVFSPHQNVSSLNAGTPQCSKSKATAHD
ncbi:hypothetical protein J1605_022485 [Eschrichtius robustus]|uniref:Uncharacterized protein n=1 Tax=Eschrichtius robustus TaxID=9764 RepID=A0AB34HAH5_ESCRO|nr:hypothetical protein J1605_022485 [Eschrichtius robustus]